MAEVTSGTDLTVIVLHENEAHALARILQDNFRGESELWELYDALHHKEDN